MKTNLQRSTNYPFNLDGPLCPLLNDAEMLTTFYAEESLRHGIKSFCKKTTWPGKPTVSFAIDPAKLQELVFNLFNTPAARAILSRQADLGRATYLDNAIWQWLTVVNPALAQRISGGCDDIKGKLFMKPEALQKLVDDFQKEKPDANSITQLAYVVLGFAMLQPDDRYSFGESFLVAYPEFAEKFGAVFK
jgi:hypothetical protein